MLKITTSLTEEKLLVNLLNIIISIQGMIKRKLYKVMRSEQNQNWPELLPLVVKSLNEREVPSRGNVKPGNHYS